MKCDSCDEKATVFYTQIADGKLKKFVLCESCANEKGITSPDGLLMAEEILNPSVTAGVEAEIFPVDSASECASCGFTLNDYQKVGRLGCPDCYSTFTREIEQRLPSLHKGAEHTGYVPEGLAERLAFSDEMSALQERLQAAVDEENYEEAAKVRDEIDQLKSQEIEA